MFILITRQICIATVSPQVEGAAHDALLVAWKERSASKDTDLTFAIPLGVRRVGRERFFFSLRNSYLIDIP